MLPGALMVFTALGLLCLGMTIGIRSGTESNDGELLPRAKRRRRKAKVDRGLPPDGELAELARVYLERQRLHWPEITNAGLLPDSNAEALSEMVEDFKCRHRTGICDPKTLESFSKLVDDFGGAYCRYSCDKSESTSILQQLYNELNKAKEEKRFIPWQYVHCDYAVTGLDAGRQGYSSYKQLLKSPVHHIETTYIDQFDRAARNELEWWKLAALSQKLRKRMIGASDGFDLSSPNSDIHITMYGLVSRLFIKQLRQKVNRGMRGRRRGGPGSLGKLALGFTRRHERDATGNLALRSDGRPRNVICIDPETAKYRELMYELYTQKNWSPYKIAKYFNDNRIDDWDGWTASGIKKTLWSASAIGRFVQNEFRNELDLETGKKVRIKNPRSEWEVFYDPELAIVPMEWFWTARRKLIKARKKSSLTGTTGKQSHKTEVTLFSKTLECGYCEEEIKLIRSAGNYKQMGCMNGPTHNRNCQLTSSKSTRIIEESLLGFIRDEFISETSIGEFVERANAYRMEASKKPKRNVGPLKAKATRLQRKIDKLLDQIEDEEDQDRIKLYDSRAVQRQKELAYVRKQIRDAERHNAAPPPPLTADFVRKSLDDLRTLLSSDVPVAAEAIRALTGPIKIRQEKPEGRTRKLWIATFSPNFLELLRHMGREKDYPESITLEFLCHGNWIIPETVEVAIEKVPAYRRLGSEMLQKHENGVSLQTLAGAYGLSVPYIAEILKFAKTGQVPRFVGAPRTGQAGKIHKYLQIQDDVVRLRDDEQMSFPRIIEWLAQERDIPVCEETVRRAWDDAHRDELRKAAEEGRAVRRGRYSHIGGRTKTRIQRLLRDGLPVNEVARRARCSATSVRRIQRKLAMNGDSSAA